MANQANQKVAKSNKDNHRRYKSITDGLVRLQVDEEDKMIVKDGLEEKEVTVEELKSNPNKKRNYIESRVE